jgi:hypothetical protein
MLRHSFAEGETLTEELRVEIYEAAFYDDLSERRIPCTIEKWFDLSGQAHRPGDLPAVTIRDQETGQIMVQEYWVNGQRHREGDKPAVIRTLNNGREEFGWFWRDELHRDHGQPATIEIDCETDTPITEAWYVHGKKMRPGGGLVFRLRDWDSEDGWYVEYTIWVDAAGLNYRENEPVEPAVSQPRLTSEFS